LLGGEHGSEWRDAAQLPVSSVLLTGVPSTSSGSLLGLTMMHLIVVIRGGWSGLPSFADFDLLLLSPARATPFR
jgi:hypothetical protein